MKINRALRMDCQRSSLRYSHRQSSTTSNDIPLSRKVSITRNQTSLRRTLRNNIKSPVDLLVPSTSTPRKYYQTNILQSLK